LIAFRSLLALVCFLVLTAAPERATAHAVLLETIPAHRAVLASAPAQIVLRFNEGVTPISLRVLDSQGRALALPAPPQSIDREVRAALPPGLGAGTYVVSYRVVSADGHPIGGALMFAVGAGPARWSDEAGTAASPGVDSLYIAAVANRAVYLAALFVAAGGLLFGAATRRGGEPLPRLGGAATIAAMTAPLGVFLHVAVVTGASDPTAAGFWTVAAATPQARSAAAALVGLALAFVVAPRAGEPARRFLAPVGAVLALAATGITGHSAAAGLAWWPPAALHLVAAGFWFGSLPPLIGALRASPSAETALLLQRFSQTAVVAVVILIIAGLALTLQRVATAEDFVTSNYGRLVIVKIVGALLLLGLAAYNKLRLTPRVVAGHAPASRRLRRVAALELVLMSAVVAVAALLTHTDPHAGHTHDHDAHAVHRHDTASALTLNLQAGERVATVEIHPAKPGRNSLTVSFAMRAGDTFTPLEASVELSLASAGIEAFVVKLSPLTPGHFAAEITEIALPGRWQVRIDALITDFEKAIFRGEAEIK